MSLRHVYLVQILPRVGSPLAAAARGYKVNPSCLNIVDGFSSSSRSSWRGSLPLSAAWSPLGGPIRAGDHAAARSGPARASLRPVFASEGPTEDYLWRSEDGGATWQRRAGGLQSPVSALAIDPSESAGDLGLDAGRPALAQRRRRRHLVPAPGDSTDQISPYVLQLLVDPHHPDTLYRVDAEDLSRTGVAVSRDGGGVVHQGALRVPGLYEPEHGATFIRTGDELLAFDHGGPRVSADGGRTWTCAASYRRRRDSGGGWRPRIPTLSMG